jgi:hypothetical protein
MRRRRPCGRYGQMLNLRKKRQLRKLSQALQALAATT